MTNESAVNIYMLITCVLDLGVTFCFMQSFF